MGATPVLVKPLTQVNTSDAAIISQLPNLQVDGQVVAMSDGGYVVVWTDGSRTYNPQGFAVLGQRYDALGERIGGEQDLVPLRRGDQFSPAVATLAGGDFAVAVVERFNGNDDITVSRYGSDLSFHGGDVIEFGFVQAIEPSLAALAHGGYAVSYTVGTGADTDIMASIVLADGHMLAQFEVHNEADNSRLSEVATLSNGNFVVVFQDEFNGSETDIDVRFRIYTATGGSVTPNPVYAAEDLVIEEDPDIAALTGGGFVIVWTDAATTVTDIRASIFTNGGAPVRTDFLVNSSQAGPQNEANVVALADSGFLVTWDDDNAGVIRAQRFDAAGNRVGDQFGVSFSEDVAGNPEAARLLDGRIAYAVTAGTSQDYDTMTAVWNPRGTISTVGDVLWQQTDGTVAIAARELAQASAGWRIQGIGDLDADGDSDVLWRHRDGAVVTWELEDGQLLTNHSIAFASTGWEIVNTGDFDADGDADVLWRHRDGAVVTWEMENGAYVQNHNIAFASIGWTIQGLGDFDGDGDADVIWRHRDGAVVTWEMENGGYVVNHNIAFASTGWEIRGTGDFDGDGDDDILWHHRDGAVVAWQMEDGAYVTNRNILVQAGGWQIVGTVDFNADGTDDLLWRHPGGHVFAWEMDNGAFVRAVDFGIIGNDWQIRGTGEFDLA